MANDFEETAKDVVGGFYDLPKTAVQAARRGIKAASNVSEQDVVEGIRGATNAVGDTAATIGNGIRGQGEFIADQYQRAKPYVGAAARGAGAGLADIGGRVASGAVQLGDQVADGLSSIRGDVSQRQGDFGAIPRAMDAAGNYAQGVASAAGNYIKNDLGQDLRNVGNALNPTPSAPPAYQLLRDMKGYAQPSPSTGNQPIAFGNAQLPAAGAQGGASSTTADNMADQMAGVKKPEDAFSPVTEGAGINIQGKANDARVASAQSPVTGTTAYDTITDPIKQAEASNRNYQEDTSRENYTRSLGLNSPDTAPTRLPSVATGSPQGGLGAGNATGAAATGRTTGDGSSNPNSPNFQPVGLGGVPIQSRDQWLAQRAQEKQEVYDRRAASNSRDEARQYQEARAAQFKEMISNVPKDISKGRRAKIIANMYGDYLGNSVRSEGQDKTLQGVNRRTASNEGIAAADNRTAATQNAFKNMMAQSNAEAASVKAQRDAAHKQARLGQYQAAINATAGKNAWQQRKAEYDVGFARAKNQREALAAQRAGLKLASDMDVQGVKPTQLGNYQTNLDTIADLSGYSDEQMAQFREDNPQRY